jgi:hypothetical protein
VRKAYQNEKIDTSRPAVPETVTVALAEIAEDMREGLLALAVGTGLQVMASMMEADVAAVCGPRGKHDPDRAAVRHGAVPQDFLGDHRISDINLATAAREHGTVLPTQFP